MSERRPYQKLRALGVRLNKRLATARDFNEIKRATLIGYGATLVISVLMLSLPLMQKLPRFSAGDVATADLKAQMDLRIADDNETERLKKAAFERERPAFDRDFEIFEKHLQQLQTEFTWIARTVSESSTLTLAERRDLIFGRMPFLEDPIYRRADIDGLFREKQIQLVENRALTLAEKAFQESGFLQQSLESRVLAEVIEKGAQIRTINAPRDAPDVVWSAEQLQTKETAVRLIVRNNQLKDSQLAPGTMRIVLTRIRQLQRDMPSLVYNPQYTLLRRNQAAQKITPAQRHVRRGAGAKGATPILT